MAYFIGRKNCYDKDEWEIHERCNSYIDAKKKLREYKTQDYLNKLSSIRPWCILDIYGGKILVIK